MRGPLDSSPFGQNRSATARAPRCAPGLGPCSSPGRGRGRGAVGAPVGSGVGSWALGLALAAEGGGGRRRAAEGGGGPRGGGAGGRASRSQARLPPAGAGRSRDVGPPSFLERPRAAARVRERSRRRGGRGARGAGPWAGGVAGGPSVRGPRSRLLPVTSDVPAKC
ncbi:hypothetical protein VULLAG_LOCUS16497 [Vulpes lagopus]